MHLLATLLSTPVPLDLNNFVQVAPVFSFRRWGYISHGLTKTWQ